MARLTNKQKKKLEQAVERGVARIVKNQGVSFVEKIDLDTLKMDDAKYCIIGQLNSGYYNPEAVFGSAIRSSRLGFTVPVSSPAVYESYDYLTTLWARKVRKIQKGLARLTARFTK
jgi:hypothetical protein